MKKLAKRSKRNGKREKIKCLEKKQRIKELKGKQRRNEK